MAILSQHQSAGRSLRSNELNLGLLLEIVMRRKWFILVPAAVIILVAAIVALALPPMYQSTATILIEQQDVPEDFVKATITTYADQQLQIINQRVMTATKLLEIINKYDLYHDLRDKKTTEEIVAMMQRNISMNPISVNVVNPRTGQPTKATIAFTLSYAGKNNPAKVQQIANVLTSLYLEENVRIREQQAGDISKFLDAEMQRVKTELEAIDKRLSAYKKEHVEELPEMMGVNMQSLNNLERSRDQLQERLANLQRRAEYLRTQLGSVPISQRRFDKDRLEELRLQLISLRNLFSEEYPEVKRVRGEIKKLEKKLEEKDAAYDARDTQPDNPAHITLSSELAGVNSEAASIRSQVADLEVKIIQYRARMAATPKVESEYMILMNERINTQAKIDDLMRKLMEARVSQGLEEGQKGERFTLIEPARLPEKPFKPNRRMILMAGIIMGIGAGGASGFLREKTDTSVRHPDDITAMSTAPVFASIPFIMTPEDLVRVKRRRLAWAGGITSGLAAAVIIFHVFIMKLDLLWFVVLKRMGW